MSKGGGGGSQTTTSEPWAGIQPYLKKGYSEAAGIYDKFSPQYYGGVTQAQFSPDQLTAQAGVRDWATQGAPTIMNPAISAYQYGTGTDVIDVAKNPYVQGMAQGAAKDAFAQLNPALAGIRQGSVMSGGYGGSRQGIAEGTAVGTAADAATRAAADVYGQAYQSGLAHQLGTLGQTGSLIGTGFKPYAALSASGQEQQAREQALIEDAKARHQFEQALPYERLSQYAGTLSGTSGLLGGAGITTAPGMSSMGRLGQAAMIGSTLFNPTSGLFPGAFG